MSDKNIIQEMNAYYGRNAPYHDACMSYTGNAAMENLLKPIIRHIESNIAGRDVLEIACGTGNWTQVLARRAASVMATDINPACLDIARQKEYDRDNVSFRAFDAYGLNDIEDKFSAAFAADWFSHIPKASIPRFLNGLHSRLLPGAKVIFIDMMSRPELEKYFSHIDRDGNRIHSRPMPDGAIFQVVKNFPDESELRHYLPGTAAEISYHEDIKLLRWVLVYKIG